MTWTNDPVADAERYSRMKDEELDRLPRCCECDNPIQDEECVVFDDEPICMECLKDNHIKKVEDLMG